MGRLKARLKRLELGFAAIRCPGCAVGRVGVHHQYKLPGGVRITLPPIPKSLPCTCRRPQFEKPTEVVAIVVVLPREFASREDAEDHYAKHVAFQRHRQPDGGGIG